MLLDILLIILWCFSQLIIDGENYGVYSFVVPVRDFEIQNIAGNRYCLVSARVNIVVVQAVNKFNENSHHNNLPFLC